MNNNNNNNKLNHLKPKEGPLVTYTSLNMNLMTHQKKYKYNLKQPVYMTNIPKPSLMKPKVDPIKLPLPPNYHHDLPTVYNGFHKRHLSVNFGFGFGNKERIPAFSRNREVPVPTSTQVEETPLYFFDEYLNFLNEDSIDDDNNPILDSLSSTSSTSSTLLEETCQNDSPSSFTEDSAGDPVEAVAPTILDSQSDPMPVSLSPVENDIKEDLKVLAPVPLQPFQINLRPVNMQPKTKLEGVNGSGAAFLMISLDGGDTWKEPKLPPPKDVKINAFAMGKNVQICGGLYDSLYHSFDGGETWDKCKDQPQIHAWTSLVISGDEDERIEARTAKGDLYVSTDLGNSWNAF